MKSINGMPIHTWHIVVTKLPESKHAARPTLLGISGVREGPDMREGITVMRSTLFSLANFQAVFSASVLDTG